MSKFQKLSILFVAFSISVVGQNYKQQFQSIDVQHYKLFIKLNDISNNIDATMNMDVLFKKPTNTFSLDFIKKDETGSGMNVAYILQNKDTVAFTHENEKLTIKTDSLNFNGLYNFTIKYSGVPKDGLIISENMFGDRTFFGDNWPNRARNWFPCVDHPLDKATVEYFVKVPNYYNVIANGILVDQTILSNSLTEYHYSSTVPISTKVMVIGAAKFAVQNLGETHNIPVSTWVYPQNKEAGFYDFEIATQILNYFIENIGSYPFEKLANVQSKTRFGGMENAGNIFYFEKSVTGKRAHEDLIAHEIAHQWFGNSATEIDWSHLWLSEGFATYFTDLYLLKTYGEKVFMERLQEQRKTVLEFYKKTKTPVVDTENKDLMSLLNANSYQKGAWVLHMLRIKLSDEFFWKGIKKYYETYQFKNASTNNFRNIMKEVSQQDLDSFFKQWLETAGHPIIKTSWIYFEKKVRLIVEQTQEETFSFPLDVELIYEDGTSEIKTINVTEKMAPYGIEVKGKVTELKFDPNTNLLFELIKDE